jgi:hypothetical protein
MAAIPVLVKPAAKVVRVGKVEQWFNYCEICERFIKEGGEHSWVKHLSSPEEARELRDFKRQFSS